MDVREWFLSVVPEEFLRETVRCIRRAYRTSYLDAYAQYGEFARNMYPQLRWVTIEQDWVALARRFDNLVVQFELNSARNWKYAKVQCGPVVMTMTMEHAHGLGRPARFRQMLAGSNQLSLFDVQQHYEPSCLYAVIEHRPLRIKVDVPGSIMVAFPTTDWSGHLAKPINLYTLFPDLALSDDVHTEQISDELPVRLRPHTLQEEGVRA